MEGVTGCLSLKYLFSVINRLDCLEWDPTLALGRIVIWLTALDTHVPIGWAQFPFVELMAAATIPTLPSAFAI